MGTPTNPPDPARQSAEERARDLYRSLQIPVVTDLDARLRVSQDARDKLAKIEAAIRAAHADGRLAGLEEAARVARAEAERNERLAETARKNGKDAGRFQTRAEACFAIAAGIRALARSAPPPNSDRLTALNEAADMIIHAAGRDPILEAFAADMARVLRSTPPPPCTCGSGGHPRKCAAHPGAYAEHVATLDAENRVADLEKALRDILHAEEMGWLEDRLVARAAARAALEGGRP